MGRQRREIRKSILTIIPKSFPGIPEQIHPEEGSSKGDRGGGGEGGLQRERGILMNHSGL